MPRTPTELKPVKKDDLLKQFVRVRLSHDVLAEAINALPDGESLEVEYTASLERGANSLETFTNALKVALAQFNMRRQLAADVASKMNAIARGSVVQATAIPEVEPIELAPTPVGRKATKKAAPTAAEIKAMSESPPKQGRKSKRG